MKHTASTQELRTPGQQTTKQSQLNSVTERKTPKSDFEKTIESCFDLIGELTPGTWTDERGSTTSTAKSPHHSSLLTRFHENTNARPRGTVSGTGDPELPGSSPGVQEVS